MCHLIVQQSPLARRRIDVIWAMLRDHTPYIEPNQPLPIAA